jgi:PPOX class probable F420-dependent enzyme
MNELPLSADEVEDLLSKPILAHLAVERNSRPHVSPVWVHYEDGVFYFTTRAGRAKGKALRENPDVSVSIATDTTPYKAIIIEGKAEIIETDKWNPIGKIVSKYVSSKFGKKEGERVLESWAKEEDRIAFKVRPTRILSWNYGKGDLQRQDQGMSMLTKFNN